MIELIVWKSKNLNKMNLLGTSKQLPKKNVCIILLRIVPMCIDTGGNSFFNYGSGSGCREPDCQNVWLVEVSTISCDDAVPIPWEANKCFSFYIRTI